MGLRSNTHPGFSKYMPDITFLPFYKTISLPNGATLLEAARKAGVGLESICAGKRVCGKCRILVEHTDGHLPHPSDREIALLGEALQREGYRLACAIVPPGDMVVRVPEEATVGRQVILTTTTDYVYPAKLHPAVKPYFLEVPPPNLVAMKGDRERLLSAMNRLFGLSGLTMDPFLTRRVPDALRSPDGAVTSIVWHGKEIVDLRRGYDGQCLGVAFDLGTTTIVCYLLDLSTGETLSVKSAMNPQIPYGDDVISRIAYCRERPDGLESLRQAVVECLNSLIQEAAHEAAVDPGQILDGTLVGNSAMHHLFFGLNPVYLSLAPYPPALTEPQDVKARDLGIRIGPSACFHLLPLKAGFVGSDAVACLLATGVHRKKTRTLLIDIGTNGEIMFGNRDRIACCSAAAGPAFEGGHITWGMRAAEGAIERVRIDPKSLDVHVETISNGGPMGICGSGIISAIAEMIRTGIVLARGNLNQEIQHPRVRRKNKGWEFVLVEASRSGIGQDIVITAKDISQIQLAKSAICSGAMVLLSSFPDGNVEKILLAGAGGTNLHPEDACTLGLIPPSCWPEQIHGVGNAAGYGACLALLDQRKRKEAARIAEAMEYRELAVASQFKELFVTNMFFPGARDFEDYQ
jgi:uncharacterized 2Fe-2S/4Fe-4S cluster protein (DUF4445 family)